MSAGLPLVSGGTDNHLMLVDVTAAGLGGKKAEAVLGDCGITVNMNMIPFDLRKPMDPSGIRIGTPALTTRGMGTDEMKRIGGWISSSSGQSPTTTPRCIERFAKKSANCANTFRFPPAAAAATTRTSRTVNQPAIARIGLSFSRTDDRFHAPNPDR